MSTSRFKVVEHPTLQPATDIVTGTGVGPFIDTGRDIKFGERTIAHIYLSKASVEEMARELGLVEGATEAQLLVAYNKGKMDALKEGLGDELVRVADALARWAAVLGTGSDADPAGTTARS